MPSESRRGSFLISTDRALLDLNAVHLALSTSYWSPGIPRDVVARGLQNCMCFGVYDTASPRPSSTLPRQIGLARVITDKATFAYLSDVYIIEEYRKQGLSKWLVESILAHPELQGLRRLCLLTRDAHGLYARYGFKPMPDPTRYMELWNPDVYKETNAPATR
jgi:GNAT superfamily N-acetyltransferase